MSSEYIFFDDALCDRFVKFLSDRGITGERRPDQIAGSVVAFPDDLPEETLDAIDAEYDSLMNDQLALARSEDGWFTHQAVGVSVTLSDGRVRQVRLPPEVAGRLLQHFTVEEVQGLVTAIARSVENPLDGPLCRKLD